MLDIIQQQQEYLILGPRRYANRGQKMSVIFNVTFEKDKYDLTQLFYV